jgi:hypothetical protein
LLFLLDSNAVSDLMRKNPRVAAQLAVLGPNDKVVISARSFGARFSTGLPAFRKVVGART